MTDSVDRSVRRILVTGASKGIGRAVAVRLAADGFAVTVHYRSDEPGAHATLDAIVAEGGAGGVLHMDVADREACRMVLEADMERHGPYHGIVCNAGIARDNAFPMMSGEDWDAVIRTDLDSFYNVVHPCIMPMIGTHRGGRIIVMSSAAGLLGNRGQVNYSAAKAGLIGAAKALAIELAKRNITVNCIAPGLIETGMSDVHPRAREQIMRFIPMQRVGKPEDVAELAAFLASDAAGYITRQVISVNGGMA